MGSSMALDGLAGTNGDGYGLVVPTLVFPLLILLRLAAPDPWVDLMWWACSMSLAMHKGIDKRVAVKTA